MAMVPLYFQFEGFMLYLVTFSVIECTESHLYTLLDEQKSALTAYQNSLAFYGPNRDPETNKVVGCTLVLEVSSRQKLLNILETSPLNNSYEFKLHEINVCENYWAKGSSVT
jgi:hypothetical protein